MAIAVTLQVQREVGSAAADTEFDRVNQKVNYVHGNSSQRCHFLRRRRQKQTPISLMLRLDVDWGQISDAVGEAEMGQNTPWLKRAEGAVLSEVIPLQHSRCFYSSNLRRWPFGECRSNCHVAFCFNMKLCKVCFLQRSYVWGARERFYSVTVICFILFKDQSINLLQLPVSTCMAIISPIKPNSLIICINEWTKELKDISAAVLTS